MKKAPAAPITQDFPNGGVPTSVEPSAAAHDAGEHIVHQVRQSTRWLNSAERSWSARHPKGEPHPETKQHTAINKPAPQGLASEIGKQTGTHHGIWKANNGVAPTGNDLEIANRLVGDAPFEEAPEVTPLEMNDLYRAYKNTPHAPASMFLKYLVHRFNHLAEYDDPSAGHKLDVQFRDLVQQGKAADKNGHVSIDDLHTWAQRWAPSIMPKLLDMRSKLQASVARGIGLNTRSINGEPYVALTRGLKSEMMSNEHPLSSHADKPDTGFGDVMHHSWVPLKDLWYSYDLGSGYPSDVMGPEDEWLVSNTGTRYQATPEDVKHHRVEELHSFFENPQWALFNSFHDDATDEQLAAALKWHSDPRNSSVSDAGQPPQWVLGHKNAGPLVHQEVQRQFPGHYAMHQYPWMPREQVMGRIAAEGVKGSWSLKNPNLTPEDLLAVSKHVLGAQEWKPSSKAFVEAWMDAPRMNSKILEQAYRSAPVGPASAHLLSSPLATPTMIQGEIDKLSQGWYNQNPVAVEELVKNIANNPHHTPEQAQNLYDWMSREGMFDAEAGGVAFSFMAPAGNLNLPEATLRDLAEKGAKPVSNSVTQDQERVTANNILSQQVIKSPHAVLALAKLASEGLIPIDWLESRMGRSNHLEPELQSAFISLAEKNRNPLTWLRQLALAKGLTQDTVNALAHNSAEDVRDILFRNKSVTPEQLREAFPKGLPFPEAPEGLHPVPNKEARAGIYAELPIGSTMPAPQGIAGEIADAYYRRKAWGERLLREHFVKPLPQNLAKSEEDLWQAQARDWLAHQKNTGFYYPTTRERALNILREQAIEPDLTDELLHGEAVFANRESPEFLNHWHKTAGPDDVVLYFETPAAPELHEDGRFYWTDRVPVVNARIADTSDAEEPLAKFHTPLLFPKLGVPDDRRETKLVSTPRERATFLRAAAAQAMRENVIGDTEARVQTDPAYRKDLLDRTHKRYGDQKTEGITLEGIAGVGHPGHGRPSSEREIVPGAGTGQFATSAAFTPSSTPRRKFGPLGTAYHQDPRSLGTTATHEDLHRIFSRIQHLHGSRAREVLAHNLMLALPHDLNRAVISHLLYRRPDFARPGAIGDSNEEAITELGSYLNAAPQRDNYHQKMQHSPEQRQAFHSQMKRAYRLLQAIAATADDKWLHRIKPWLQKGEAGIPFHEVQLTGLSAQQAHEFFKGSLKLSKAQPDLLDPNLFAFEYENDLELQEAVNERHEELELRKMALIDQTENPSFRKWFKGSKVADEAGKPLRVYHGTTHAFESFGNRKGNPEGYYGRAHYFTNSPVDASQNYARVGPDLKNRLEAERDRIDQGDNLEENFSDIKQNLVGHNRNVIPAYLSMKNPVVVTPKGGTHFQVEQEFNDFGDPVGEERGSGVDLWRAVNSAAADYGLDGQKVWDEITGDGKMSEEGMSAYDIEQRLRNSGQVLEAQDPNTGERAGNEFIRDMWRNAGHDGVIMDAQAHFGKKPLPNLGMYGNKMQTTPGMPGVKPGTMHYIAFEPTQVKGVFNRTFNPKVAEFGKGEYTGNEELKSLYRQAAKAFHPDLAVDEADRVQRTEKLSQLNDAYRKRDIHSVRRMLAPHVAFAWTPTGGKLPLGKGEESINIALPGEKVFGPGEESAARVMLGHRKDHELALAAARFLVGRKQEVDEDMFRLALNVYDGDYERAALIAVGLTDSDANLRALRAALKLGEFSPDHIHELSKAELMQPGMPHIESVVAAVPEAQDAADEVLRAVTAGLVQPLVLGGKHSKGALAIRDPKKGSILLLKPGSGKMSPAAGARDDTASQSAREACFWHCMDEVGLGNYGPRCDLLLVNGAEVAAMRLLGATWHTLDKRNRQVAGYARETLTPYLKRGDVHRLAALLWVLGETDAHGQNLMSHAEAIALIDHGSSFAGPRFDPGQDAKSFTPYVLRVFGQDGYSKAPAQERVKSLPVLDRETDSDVRKWLLGIDPVALVEIMQSYGIGAIAQEAVVKRLDDLQRYAGPSLSAYINGLWAGTET